MVSLWIASLRRFATRVWIRVTSLRAVSQRTEGRCPVRRSGPTRRDNVREAVRSAFRALFRCRGLGTGSPVDSTARALIPRSTPTVASGRAGTLTWRATSTVNAQYQRPASRRTVADRIRAVPVSSRRASLRVDSCVLIMPTLGKVTCLRSVSTRITPVVNRTLGAVRRRTLKRGNPTLRPARLPHLESAQFLNERATPSRPVLNASLLHSLHHGATSDLAPFQARRNAGRFHSSAAVRSSLSTP